MIGALVAGITGSGGASLSSYESIATATATGSSTTITFSSIPSTFKHLQIRGIPYASSGGFGGVQMTINSDTATNYATHQVLGNGSTVTATGFASNTYMFSGVNSSSAGGSGLPAVIIDILDYTSTSKYKTVRSFGGGDNNGSGQVRLNSGLWMNTAAITTITLKNEDGVNWASQTTFALYGIKEA